MDKGALNIYGGFSDRFINPSNFDWSFDLTIDNFADDLYGVSHDCDFGDLVLRDLFHPKEKRKRVGFIVGFSSKTPCISCYLFSSEIENDPTRTCLPSRCFVFVILYI